MFEETRLREVVLRIKNKERQDVFYLDIPLGENGEVYIGGFTRQVKEIFELDDNQLLYYYDYLQNKEICLPNQDLSFIHCSAIISENMISLVVEPRISDEIMANSPIKQETVRSRRSPERAIWEVFELVQAWRQLYRNGTIDQKGEKQKVNLDKAATIIGIPRKSLEDYYLLIRNGYHLGFNYTENRRNKIGVLRSYVKGKKKQEKSKHGITEEEKEKLEGTFKEQKLLNLIRKQIFGFDEKQFEKELFNVVSVEMESHNGSSDEDVVLEN